MRRVKFFNGYIGTDHANEKMENEIHSWLAQNNFALVNVSIAQNEESGIYDIAVVYDVPKEAMDRQ